jgi:hypothetical protein
MPMTTCFLVSEGDRWIPLAHSHAEVQQRLLNNSSNQRALGVDIFWYGELHDLITQSSNISVKRKLTEYFNVFNDIFFFGALTEDLCKLTLVKAGWRRWNRNRDGEHDEGFTTDPRKTRRPGVSQSLTKIYIYERLDQNDEVMLLHKYLEILLHEMIHAFIHIYICLCPSCKISTLRLEGSGGHGVTWHLLADATEDFSASFLGLALDLGRADAVEELEEDISIPAFKEAGVDRTADGDAEDDTTDGASSEKPNDSPK